MVFSNFSLIAPTSIKMEEYVDITVENDATLEAYIVCNGQMNKMYVDKNNTPNGLKIRFYGWMGQMGTDLDITLIGINGDVFTQPSIITITFPEAPILPVLQYVLNWLKNHPILGTYAKVYVTLRKPYKQITTRPQILAIAPEIELNKPHIGNTVSEWKETVEFRYIADIRRKTDVKKHEDFLHILTNYLDNNPNLSNIVGLVEIDPIGANMPDERLENIYLHESVLRCMVSVIPEYADQVP